MLDGAAVVAGLREGPWGPRLDAVAAALSAPMALVGGFVRDALLRRTPGDLDVVTEGEPGACLPVLARAHPGWAAVPLDAGRGYWRLVFPDGEHLDVARAEGDRLVDDLRRRDFTANALAIAWPQGELLDPTGGLADLDAQALRLPRPDALRSDPLRVLRAWRFAARLGFAPTEGTLEALREATPLLPQVAGERVWAELALWFAVPALPHLEALDKEGLWAALGQGPAAEAVARARALPGGEGAPWAAALAAPLVADRPLRSVLVASALAGAPAPLAALAERLRWGKQERVWAEAAWAGAAYLAALGPQPGPRGLHRLLGLCKGALPGALVLRQAGLGPGWPLAHALPQEGPWAPSLGPLDAAWAFAEARRAQPLPRWVDGLEATEWAGLSPGPAVARLLAELQEAQAAGEVLDRGQAEAWVRAWRGMS